MATFEAFVLGAGLDGARMAENEGSIRQASLTIYLFDGHVVDWGQSLFKLGVVISVGYVYATDPTACEGSSNTLPDPSGIHTYAPEEA